MAKPHFTIKNKFQKRSDLYQNILTHDVLADVCQRIACTTDFTVDFDNSGYNKGRMAILEHGNEVSFISFSDTENAGRNASMQSVPSALMSYHEEASFAKNIYFYFLRSSGNHETDYHNFMYRLLATAGVGFLNQSIYLSQPVQPFNSVSDMILSKNANRGQNRSNNSSYITTGCNNIAQVYGKTYGANKYETTLLCLALSRLETHDIELYQIIEGKLKSIPTRCADVLSTLSNITIIETDLIMDRNKFEQDSTLRSPRYTYNLLAKLGPKKCALCDCKIPELIQGAHIWPVAAIKKEAGISIDTKFAYAIDGENGLWLCANHHVMFDQGIIIFDKQGKITKRTDMADADADYINWSMPIKQLEPRIITAQFLHYLDKRYSSIA